MNPYNSVHNNLGSNHTDENTWQNNNNIPNDNFQSSFLNNNHQDNNDANNYSGTSDPCNNNFEKNNPSSFPDLNNYNSQFTLQSNLNNNQTSFHNNSNSNYNNDNSHQQSNHINHVNNTINTAAANLFQNKNIVNINVDFLNSPYININHNNNDINECFSLNLLRNNDKASDFNSGCFTANYANSYYSNINYNKDDDEISKISSFRKEMISESSSWKRNIHEKIETRFNDFRKKMRNKIFEKKFEMLVDEDCGTNQGSGVSGFIYSNNNNNNNNNNEPYDINRFIQKQTSGEQSAFETIKRYKEMGLFQEDFYEFHNFDFRNDVCSCRVCDDYIFLIDKKLIICSNNCFSFAIDPAIFSGFTLDMIMELFFKCLFEHKGCQAQIEIFYFGDENNQQKMIYFLCSKCLSA